MKENMTIVISNKIENYIKNKYKGNINAFKKDYPNLDEFIPISNLEVIMTHTGLKIINDEDYTNIINNLTLQYNNQNKINILKILNNKKVAGFVDTLILALITGTFITIILLNIYSKIVQNI